MITLFVLLVSLCLFILFVAFWGIVIIDIAAACFVVWAVYKLCKWLFA